VSSKAWPTPASPPTVTQESSCTYAHVLGVRRAGPGRNGKGVSAAAPAAVRTVPRAPSRPPFRRPSARPAQRGCKARKGRQRAASQRAVRASPAMWPSQGAPRARRALRENTGRKTTVRARHARQIQTQKLAARRAPCACALQDLQRAPTAHAVHKTCQSCECPSACPWPPLTFARRSNASWLCSLAVLRSRRAK